MNIYIKALLFTVLLFATMISLVCFGKYILYAFLGVLLFGLPYLIILGIINEHK
jgi:hypothetical protein